MRLSTLSSGVLPLLTASIGVNASLLPSIDIFSRATKIAPRVFIISMFAPEGDVWYGIPEFHLLAHNISVTGFSPLYPDAHCTKDGMICQLVTGESEINAATTITSLILSPRFDLTKTYFLVAGIAGVNPEEATLGSVTFARYTVQVALQYEFDAREKPKNFSTGYFPQGSFSPNQYPQSIYGTEIFEVNNALRLLAAEAARGAKLNDSSDAVSYRSNYKSDKAYAAGAAKPGIKLCDSATSDVYYSGALLGEAFGKYMTLVSNGSAVYCTTAQEDNATLEAMLRGAKAGLVDFARIILMRTASDFDRPYPGEAAVTNLLYANQGGFDPAIQNIYLAGVRIVEGIVKHWAKTFEKGIKARNYIGDIFDTLPQDAKPDFGLPSQYLSATGKEKREMAKSMNMRRTGGKRVGPAMRLTEPVA